MFIGRVVWNLTEAIPEERNAVSGQVLGRCPFGGYFSTQSSTLPAAMATGKLTVRPYSIVTKLLYDKNSKSHRCRSAGFRN